MVVKTIFWLLVSVLLYTYIGYSLVLLFTSLLSRRKKSKTFTVKNDNDLPAITFLIAAYNEREIVPEKVKNTFEIDYPKEKVFQLWVTDGSTDGTEDILRDIENLEVIHNPQRKGKTAAINRGMKFVKTPFTIFSDANTLIAPESARLLIREFDNPKVGCVAGEKRINFYSFDNAVSTGEGIYWKYESLIKHLESQVGSTICAAGELYAIKSSLFRKVDEDIILDDFIVSTNTIKEGYSIKYIPDAYAIEKASLNISEEMKRKRRIAAGSFQVLFRYTDLLNFIRHPRFSFMYISHKVLRWLIVPFAIFIIPIFNILILFDTPSIVYLATMVIQTLFISLSLMGWLVQNTKTRHKSLFLPYYLVVMNLSVIKGFWMYIRRKHNVTWEKSARQT